MALTTSPSDPVSLPDLGKVVRVATKILERFYEPYIAQRRAQDVLRAPWDVRASSWALETNVAETLQRLGWTPGQIRRTFVSPPGGLRIRGGRSSVWGVERHLWPLWRPRHRGRTMPWDFHLPTPPGWRLHSGADDGFAQDPWGLWTPARVTVDAWSGDYKQPRWKLEFQGTFETTSYRSAPWVNVINNLPRVPTERLPNKWRPPEPKQIEIEYGISFKGPSPDAARPELIREDCPACGAPLESYNNKHGRLIVDCSVCDHVEVGDPDEQARNFAEQVRRAQEDMLSYILYGGRRRYGARTTPNMSGNFPRCIICGRRHP